MKKTAIFFGFSVIFGVGLGLMIAMRFNVFPSAVAQNPNPAVTPSTTATATVAAAAKVRAQGGTVTAAAITDNATGFMIPDYFGTANWANSPALTKFVDSLPGLGPTANNTLGQYIPVAVADNTTFVGSDYYEIAEVEYTQKLHTDLPASHLRGYVQIQPAGSVTGFTLAGYAAAADKLAYASQHASYLGPVIVAQKDKPVRIKLTNLLSTGAAGKLPVPVDTTYMGADSAAATDNRTALHLHGGNTPWISDGTPRQWVKPKGELTGPNKGETTRDVPDMWFDASGNVVPAALVPADPIAAGLKNNPGDGAMTFYFTNQQSARLMFYHDHAEGITRLNVYAGMAAGYVLQDPTEQAMVSGGTAQTAAAAMGYSLAEQAKYDSVTNYAAATLPPLADTIPLIIQEKTFVPNNTKPVMNFYGAFASQLQSQDPTWRWGTNFNEATNVASVTGLTGNGDLWVPHVFMPNQNPGDITGGNAFGRWDYGPWFWPPFTAISNGPIDNPYYDPACNTTVSYCEPATIPGTPNGSTKLPVAPFYVSPGVDPLTMTPGVKDAKTGLFTSSPSSTPEAFNDTPLVNGTVYPYITVDPKQYRLRILSVGNDRMLDLSMVVAASKNSVTTADANAGTTGVAKVCDGSDSTITYDECTEVKMVPMTSTQNAAVPFPAHWYTKLKGGVTFDGRPSGVFDPRTRGPAMVQIGTEGGFLSSPVVIKNQPVNYEYNPKNILVNNIKEHALLLGPAERADVLVDFSNFAGSTLILYNDAGAPVPAWDLRLDYYTGGFDNTDTGGAFSTVPGYGPNSRTIMQIRVSKNGGTVAANTSQDSTGTINLPALTTAVQTAFKTSQEPIIVPQAAYNDTYGLTGVNAVPDSLGTNLSRIADYQLTFKPFKDANPVAGPAILEPNAVTVDLGPKTIIEDWTMNWGRMNALFGTEVPRTNATIQTSIPQAYIDPPTELVKITPNTNAVPITGTLADGTQLWKVTHNGVDSHSIHFHLFHVQLVNRVGWDGAVYPPEANELGWKDSLLMHPLSDVIVALRPMTMDLPFKVANSHRKIDPSNTAVNLDFFNLNPMTGNGSNVTQAGNAEINYGWEYVWHCHILGHEENDMMRSIAVAQPPEAPSALTAKTVANGVKLDWKDNSVTSNWVEITRSLDGVMNANNSAFQTIDATFDVPVATLIGKPECDSQTGCLVSYTDTTANAGTSYHYRVVANNTVGGGVDRADSPLAQDPATGFFNYSGKLPAGVQSLLPTVAGVAGYTGYANVTASSDAVTASRLLAPAIATVTGGPLAFADQLVGINSAAKTVTLTNTGSSNLNITGAALTTGTDFAITNACGPTLAPAASCNISVTFKPTAVAALSDTLTITTNVGPQTVNMTGNGIAGVPVAAISGPLAFGNQVVNTPSLAKVVTISNGAAATANLTFPSVAVISGVNAADFTIAANTCASVVPGTSCSISVVFNPAVVLGAETASLAIATNELLKPTLNVALSGTSVALPVAPVAPTSVVIQRTSTTRASLSWVDASNNEATFQVQTSVNGGGTWTNVGAAIARTAAQVLATGVPVTAPLITVSNTTNALYRVNAINATGTSSSADVRLNDTVAPLAPTGLTATATSTSVTLNWVDAANNNASYNIQRASNATFNAGVNISNNVAGNLATLTQTGRNRNTTYYYRIQAVNSVGVSAWVVLTPAIKTLP